jgi:hypothetical protein
MAMKKCKECGNEISTKAESCPKCGAVLKMKTGCLGYIGVVFIIFFVLSIIGSLMNDDTSTDRHISSSAVAGKPAQTEPVRVSPAQENGLSRPQKNAIRSAKQYLRISGFSRSGLIKQLSSDAGDGYSIADATAAVDSLSVDWNEQAVRSSNRYLSISGFSRSGLIKQLSSDAGDGYSVTEATAAVDSLNVDWNEQAVRSAKRYLGISGFSCKGLIEQLSSSAGDEYTVSEATYGAQQAGACE